MLNRKTYNTLEEWKMSDNKKPLIIKGCRQCGKTFSVMHFAQESYRHVTYVNFVQNPDYALAFKDSKMVDDITMSISTLHRLFRRPRPPIGSGSSALTALPFPTLTTEKKKGVSHDTPSPTTLNI